MPVGSSRGAAGRAALLDLAANPPGGSFAFVMATGIVSIAAELQDFHWIALFLFAINVIAFAALSLLSLLRLARHPGALLAELSRHETGAGFLTIVAGASMVGDQFALLTSNRQVTAGLWLAACGLWVVLVYALFTALTIRRAKPPLATGLDGTWLLVVVATESLTTLGTYVASIFARPEIVLFLSLCWFLLGGLFYLVIISLILLRWLFEPMPPRQLTPPYWINMGAVAIATLAGARLESIAGTYPLVAGLGHAITAATVLSWTVATWWIPLLVTLMLWRHKAGAIRLRYRFEYWSMVFPIGMYTAATWTFSHVNGIDFLNIIPRIFLWVALAAWVAAFIGMTRRALGHPLLSSSSGTRNRLK